MNPKPLVGSDQNLRLGREIYTYICATCRGFNAEGSHEGNVPHVAKQHYPFLRLAIVNVALLHRRISTAGQDMVLRKLSAVGKDAVADYMSRLGESGAALDLKPTDA